MERIFLGAGALSGLAAVATGAFAAHALEDRLPAASLAVFEVASRYQMIHALALILTALLLRQLPLRCVRFAGWAFIVGTCLFSGSLYLLALTGTRWLGAITPLGGIGFVAGWAALGLAALRRPPEASCG